MKNCFLSDRTASDIEKQVAKVIRDLDTPAPPLVLEDVRGLLKLDRHYYSSTNDGPVREVIHKMTMAGKQILQRPSIIFDVIKKLSLKALYLYDRKRILIDSELPTIKQRWGEIHEIGHSIIPWHRDLVLGDDKTTLTPACHAQIEAEANYAASELAFLQDQFREAFVESEVSIASIKRMAKLFGNSIACTMWRTVESLSTPAVGLVSGHPLHRSANFDPAAPCRYFIRSKSFAAQFADLTDVELFSIVRSYCTRRRKGPLGAREVILKDNAGRRHVFFFETFYNQYEALTVGTYRKAYASIHFVLNQ